ncbi:MAG: copper resistance protein CopC [Chloroflexi bacterium]|nr:copper resistance protein CopC [Chloroflexota bacterium]
MGLLILLGTLAAATLASAHAFLLRTDPPAGAVLSTSPTQVRLSFSEPIEAVRDAIVVIAPSGRPVQRGAAQVEDGTTLVVGLQATEKGTYTVRWRAISADSHPVSGNFQFSVGAPSSIASSVSGATGVGLPLESFGRGLHLLGLVLLLGSFSFLFIVLKPSLGAVWDNQAVWRVAFDRTLRLAQFGTALLLVANLALLPAQTLSVSFSVAEAFSPGQLAAVLMTRFGALWALRTVVVVAFGGLLWWLSASGRASKLVEGEWPASPWFAVAMLGAALLLLTSLLTHAAVTEPVWLSLLVDFVHLGSAVLWIGGLVALVVVLPAIAEEQEAMDAEALLSRAVSRFSTLALASFEILLVTGLYQVWAQVEGPDALASTSYGQTLLIKLALVVAMAMVAAVNLLVMRPAYANLVAANPGEEARALWSLFRRLVGVEASLGVAVLLVVGVLTALPPARSVAGAASAAGLPQAAQVTLAQNAGEVLVTLELSPGALGPNTVAVMLRDPVGQPVVGATVRLRATPPADIGGSVTVSPLDGQKDGRYIGKMAVPSPGRWRLEVVVSRAGIEESSAAFDLALPVAGAKEIMALADETMDRLHTLVEENSLTSGGPVILTHLEYAAPDRMHITVADDGESYLIGKRRYDRVPGGPWQAGEIPGDGIRWPDWQYSRVATDVTLLGREELNGVECFVVSFLDPSFNGRYRFWIDTHDYLVRKLTMMATGHYMTSTFSGFDAPISIDAPTGVSP